MPHLGFLGTQGRTASKDARRIRGLRGSCWATSPRNLGVSDRTLVMMWTEAQKPAAPRPFDLPNFESVL